MHNCISHCIEKQGEQGGEKITVRGVGAEWWELAYFILL